MANMNELFNLYDQIEAEFDEDEAEQIIDMIECGYSVDAAIQSIFM